MFDCFSASAQTDIDTIVYDGLDRIYEFHIPASYDGSKRFPWCLICMDGAVILTNSEFILKWMESPISIIFIVVYPNAWEINGVRLWNLSYDVSAPGVTPVIPDDVGFVDSLIGLLYRKLRH